MELPFVTLDVFTQTRFRGNPLAVVTIPASASPKPSQAQKQAIAREFNLSETVFVHEPAPGELPSQRHIDIFITNAEIPFAGHPTIGTAVSLLSAGVDTLITKAGPIALSQPRPGFVQAAIPHNVRCHQKRLVDVANGPVAFSHGYLSLDASLRDLQLAAPVVSIVKGMTFVLVELPDLQTLARVQSTREALPRDEVLDHDWQQGFISYLYYVFMDEKWDNGKPILSIRARMLEVGFEDPATGSACCALGSSLVQRRPALQDQTVVFEIAQGVEMGRESNILVEVASTGSNINSVSLAGTAIAVMRGHVTV